MTLFRSTFLLLVATYQHLQFSLSANLIYTVQYNGLAGEINYKQHLQTPSLLYVYEHRMCAIAIFRYLHFGDGTDVQSAPHSNEQVKTQTCYLLTLQGGNHVRSLNSIS